MDGLLAVRKAQIDAYHSGYDTTYTAEGRAIDEDASFRAVLSALMVD